MNPERPNQDELQRALALKGLKQPPQRFFEGLSEKVMDRLQHPEPPPEPTLLQRLGLDFDTKTVVLCLSGLAVSGLLAFALISSRGIKAPPPATTPDPRAPQPIRAGAVGLENTVPMPSPPAKPSESGGGAGAEPVTVSPDSGRRIPPPPPLPPRPAPVTPGNSGK